MTRNTEKSTDVFSLKMSNFVEFLPKFLIFLPPSPLFPPARQLTVKPVWGKVRREKKIPSSYPPRTHRCELFVPQPTHQPGSEEKGKGRGGGAVPHFVSWRKKGGQISFILGGEGEKREEIVWHLESQNLAPFLPQAVKGIFASRDGERKGPPGCPLKRFFPR